MKDQFYITLPSNSSMRFFRDNVTTSYTTQLPRQIDLVGEWEVALSEIQYPLTFQTITLPRNMLRFHRHYSPAPAVNFNDVPLASQHRGVGAETYFIDPGVYTTIWQIIGALNGISGLNDHFVFGRAETVDDRLFVERICTCQSGHYLYFRPDLYRQLGFPKMTTNIVEKLVADYPVNLTAGIPPQMFIYSDLVEPRIVGDVYAPLLRIVPTLGKNFTAGGSESRVLSPAHYLPLLLTNFHTIDIDIRDALGQPMPFTHGTLTVTLHFKRIH